MRTTLTLDDDVAAHLRQTQKRRKVSLKLVVNEALREGLAAMDKPAVKPVRFETKPLFMGQFLMNMDNSAEVLEMIEGPFYK
jgi:hypothetical protein